MTASIPHNIHGITRVAFIVSSLLRTTVFSLPEFDGVCSPSDLGHPSHVHIPSEPDFVSRFVGLYITSAAKIDWTITTTISLHYMARFWHLVLLLSNRWRHLSRSMPKTAYTRLQARPVQQKYRRSRRRLTPQSRRQRSAATED